MPFEKKIYYVRTQNKAAACAVAERQGYHMGADAAASLRLLAVNAPVSADINVFSTLPFEWNGGESAGLPRPL